MGFHVNCKSPRGNKLWSISKTDLVNCPIIFEWGVLHFHFLPGSENYAPRPEQPVFNCKLHKGKDHLCLSLYKTGANCICIEETGARKGLQRGEVWSFLFQQGLRPPLYFEIKISHQARMKTHTQTSQRNTLAHEIKTQPVGRQASKRQEAGRHTVLAPENGTFSTVSPGDSQFQKQALTWMWYIFLPIPIQYLLPLPLLYKPAISHPQHLSAANSLKGLISKKDAPGLCYQSYLILHSPRA